MCVKRHEQLTHASSCVDVGAAIQQQRSTFDVVALSAHVQRSQKVLGLSADVC